MTKYAIKNKKTGKKIKRNLSISDAVSELEKISISDKWTGMYETENYEIFERR